MQSSAGTLLGAQNWAGSRPLKPVPCSTAPGSLSGTFRPIVPNAAESAGLKHTEISAVWAYSVCGYTSPSRWPCDHFLHVSRTAALSVEGSRLARRPPRKRRAAAFTPRSETTIGTGLNSSERDDIQTMDRHVFRAVVLRRNGTGNPACHLRSFACIREDRTMLSVRPPDAQEDLSPPTT
jgi:hypothetical protein